jgi:hypothetical protein
VATQLLLAENANIAGWVFRNNRLETQEGGTYLDGSGGFIKGFIINPYVDLGTLTKDVILNFANGFNYIAKCNFINGQKTIYIPCDSQYNGVICLIFSTSFSKSDVAIRIRLQNANAKIIVPGYDGTGSKNAVNLYNRKIRLEAMPVTNLSGTYVNWYVDNYSDFDSDDFLSL